MGLYKIREVDGKDPMWARHLLNLHAWTFGAAAPLLPTWGKSRHWIAHHEEDGPVAFGSMLVACGNADLTRAGVLKRHRGHGLQKRLIHARVNAARRAGCTWAVTYTIDNPRSDASIEACGFKTYNPANPWGGGSATYWRKELQ